LLLTICGTVVFGQYYSIRRSQLDSLIWIGQKYIGIDSAYDAYLAAIEALQASISEKTEVVTIQGEQLKNYLILIDALKATITNDRELAMIERAELRQKVKKRNRVIIGMAGTIAVLVAVILGG